jgi:hypothetical protein
LSRPADETTAIAVIRQPCVDPGLKRDIHRPNQRYIPYPNELSMDSSHRELTDGISA